MLLLLGYRAELSQIGLTSSRSRAFIARILSNVVSPALTSTVAIVIPKLSHQCS